MPLWPCVALSGAAALALEMLWMRSAGLVLGATAATTAMVLACYFAGLGLGAAAGRAPGSRPVVRYGLLQLGVAAGRDAVEERHRPESAGGDAELEEAVTNDRP